MDVHRLVTHLPDLARRIAAFERGLIDHAEREFERLDFRVLLEAAAVEARDAFFDADLIDRRGGLPMRIRLW